MTCDSLQKRRTQNKSILLSYIKHSKHAVKQPELCRYIGLTKVTVANIVKELKSERLIKTAGSGQSSVVGGRRPELLKLNKNAAYFICMSLTSNDVKVAILNINYEIVKVHRFAINLKLPVTEIMDQLAQIIKVQIDESSLPLHKIKGVGIGMPGAVDSKNGICVYYAKAQWSNLHIARILEKKCGLPVFVNNRVRLMALAEYSYHFKEKLDSYLFISIDNGLGSALILDGKINEGKNSMAGEIGHSATQFDGALCTCGKRNCLQMFMSEQGFIKRLQQLSGRDPETYFPDGFSLKAFFEAYIAEDVIVKQIIDEGIECLAHQISQIVNLLDIEYIFIGGKVIKQSKGLIIEKVKKYVIGQIFDASERKLEVLATKEFDMSVLLGASAMVYKNIY